MKYDRNLVVLSALVALGGCSAQAAPEGGETVDTQASDLGRPGSAPANAALSRPVTGPVSVVSGQSIRLSAVQPVLSRDRGAIPPGPCRVQLSFLDAAGAAVASSRVVVAPGSPQHLDFDASSLNGAAGGRVTLIPAIAPVAVGNPDFNPACLYTVEVFNTRTGQRSVVTQPALLRDIGNPDLFQGIGNPDFRPGAQGIGNPDFRPGALEFGFAGLVAGQTARLNLQNQGTPPGLPPGPCRANVAFVDEAGAVLAESQVDLAAHQSATLELSASRLGVGVGGATVRPVISSIGNPDLRNGVGNPDFRPGACLASFEIANDAGGATALRQDPAVVFGVQDADLGAPQGCTGATNPNGACPPHN